MATTLSGQMDLSTAQEGVTLADNTDVAHFTDSNTSDTASDLTATINWGDGTSSSGPGVTIVGSNGSFTVEGGHTYADELSAAPISVTLSRPADSSTGTASGNVTVGESDVLFANLAQPTITSAGDVLTGQRVANFVDTNAANNVASDLTATINWGDGTTSTGVVAIPSGTNIVTADGTHTYAAPGVYRITTTLTDDAPGTASATVTNTATVGLAGQGVTASVTEGTALPNNTVVATFTDGDSADTAASFTATIDWGDGTSSSGSGATIVGSNGSFTVEGTHTYADELSAPLDVTLTRAADNTTATATGTITVDDASVILTSVGTLTPTSNVLTDVEVVVFTESNPLSVASDFTASINWGDGTSSAGTVSGAAGSFTVDGSHSYTTQGFFSVPVTVADDPPSTFGLTIADDVIIGLGGTEVFGSATEGTALPNNTVVATFTDADSADTAASFTATINWGDGTSSSGSGATIVGSNGSFTVEGTHTYADEGNDQASVTLTRTADQVQAIASGLVSVAEGDVLTPHGTTLAVTPKQAFSGAVATFTDADTITAASDFTATIDWGDGQTTTGTLFGANGSFTVDGSHTYSAAGQETVKVTLTDDAPGTAVATATSTIISRAIPFDLNGDGISDLVFQNNGTPGIWLWNGTAPTAEVALTDPGPSWHIITSRDVNGDGNADLIWQNSDGTPGIWLMNGTTPIAEVGLTDPGPSWHIVAAGDVNGDGNADLIWQDKSGTLGVWEMNGTTPIAEAAIGNPGSNWKVVGSADFNGDGKDDILLQNSTTGNLMIDLMNGTSIASTVSITVGDPSWHAVSTGEFNGQAEIAWQNNSGQVGIWLMNGTTPVAEAGLGNPGAGWQLVSIDHFTPNGQADLLFQNTSGPMMLWEMNGTNVASTLSLPNPTAAWQSVNGHPFATG